MSAHEGQGRVMWRQASQGWRVSPAHGGRLPWVGTFDVVGDRDPVPGRAGCPPTQSSRATTHNSCPRARRVSLGIKSGADTLWILSPGAQGVRPGHN